MTTFSSLSYCITMGTNCAGAGWTRTQFCAWMAAEKIGPVSQRRMLLAFNRVEA